MAFYDTCRKGCFFVCASRASDVCCVVKSQCHTLKHDFLFLSDIFPFVVSVTGALRRLTTGPTITTNISPNRKSFIWNTSIIRTLDSSRGLIQHQASNLHELLDRFRESTCFTLQTATIPVKFTITPTPSCDTSERSIL